jgi:hypothetical protein
LVFGIPAILTGWVLARATPEILKGVSIATFSCLASLAINAALLITFSALKASGVEPFDITLSHLHIEHGIWFVLMFITGIHFATSAAMFGCRMLRYATTINEDNKNR